MTLEKPGSFFLIVMIAMLTCIVAQMWLGIVSVSVARIVVSEISEYSLPYSMSLTTSLLSSSPPIEPTGMIRVFLFVMIVPFMWKWCLADNRTMPYRCLVGATVVTVSICSFTGMTLEFKPWYFFLSLFSLPAVIADSWLKRALLIVVSGLLTALILLWSQLPLFDAIWYESYGTYPQSGDWLLAIVDFGRYSIASVVMIAGSIISFNLFKDTARTRETDTVEQAV